MMHESDRFFVITGGPGSGKSSLIAALAASGMPGMPEAGRAIIRQQVAIGGRALPWGDQAAFAEQMLGWELRSHDAAHAHAGPVIFDRGVPDIIGYLTLSGLPVPPHLAHAARLHRYNRQVLIAPHWPDIYAQDAERKQSPQEAEATFGAMVATYTALDYELVPLPRASIEARAAFVRQIVGRH